MDLQQVINAVTLGSVFALFALGLSLAWGSLDVLNLAHGGFFVAGAWAAYEITSRVQAPFLVVVAGGLVTQQQVDRALQQQLRTGARLGETLVAGGAMTQAALDGFMFRVPAEPRTVEATNS